MSSKLVGVENLSHSASFFLMKMALHPTTHILIDNSAGYLTDVGVDQFTAQLREGLGVVLNEVEANTGILAAALTYEDDIIGEKSDGSLEVTLGDDAKRELIQFLKSNTTETNIHSALEFIKTTLVF